MIHRIYPEELEITDTADTVKSPSYFDIYLEIDGKGKLLIKLYGKCDDFSFSTVNLATSLQHLNMEFFISQFIYVIPELTITTQTFVSR